MSTKITPLQKQSGRGSSSNEVGRFEKWQRIEDRSHFEHINTEDISTLQTEYYKDTTKTIITTNDSPDIGFRYSINAYRGCEHGCAYCYARPTHEYLGLSAGLDFESKIFVKENAASLLRAHFQKPSWQPATIAMSGVTDCYQPIERKLQITRQCLEVFLEFYNPVGIITKNHLVTRDIDILSRLAEKDCVFVFISITSLDSDLARKLEPRTSSPQKRLEAIQLLSKNGIPSGVNIAPVIPGLNDHEVPFILEAAKQAGAKMAGYTPLRLPYSVGSLFTEWLQNHYPLKKDKVLHAIQSLRGGKLNDPNFGSRMQGQGIVADTLLNLFAIFYKKYGFGDYNLRLSTEYFQRKGQQLSLF